MGHLLTIFSVLVSVSALIFAWRKDRRSRLRLQADKIRHSTGIVIAKIDRWKELSLSFFNQVEGYITDADVLLTKTQDPIETRDALWRSLIASRAELSKAITAESIETAYAELYGYDPDVRALFVATLEKLRKLDHVVFTRLLYATQYDVLNLGTGASFYSAQLGNALRMTAARIASELAEYQISVIEPFRIEMLKLVEGTDQDIVEKRIRLESCEAIWGDWEIPTSEILHWAERLKGLEVKSNGRPAEAYCLYTFDLSAYYSSVDKRPRKTSAGSVQRREPTAIPATALSKLTDGHRSRNPSKLKVSQRSTHRRILSRRKG